jgi:small-conductance mechanosensitive channel
MARLSSARTMLAVGTVIVGLATTASVRAVQSAAPARTQMDELLAEVRAIRADLDRAAAASLRGQLLGMRLQMQEQRVAALARQLSEVQQRLRESAQARTALSGQLKMFAGMKDPSDPPGVDDAMKSMLGPLKQQLAALDKSDAELKLEESTLIAQMQEEQSRWSAFNAQIEELERVSAGKVIR